MSLFDLFRKNERKIMVDDSNDDVIPGASSTENGSPLGVRFNNILSGGVDFLSIREILEYYLISRLHQTQRENYDYFWSNFLSPLEMNLTDLVEILSFMFSRNVLPDYETNTILDYMAGRCMWKDFDSAD